MLPRLRRLTIALLLLCSLATTAAAQEAVAPKVEINPFIGFRFGDDYADGDLFDEQITLDEGVSYGVTVDIALSPGFKLELLASHQDTELLTDEGFLSPEIELFDLDVDYYHIGLLYEWGPGQVRPFIVGTLGVTSFRPADDDFESETRFSAGLGGGVKIFFNRNVGLRFEGRTYSSLVDDEDDVYCDRFDCYGYSDSYLHQLEVRGGLIFAF